MSAASVTRLLNEKREVNVKSEIKASMSRDRQVSVLEELISRPPRNSRVIEFSPKLAEYVLTQLNQNNRPLKPAKIKTYASDMSDGRWGLTGDTVKFGSDRQLKDGQNRLAACVRAGKPFKTHAVFGIDPQLFARMDIGKNRNAADVFSIAGIRYANHVAAATRWYLILTSSDPTNRGAQFTNEELLKAYREQLDPDRLEDSIRHALMVRKTCRHPVGPLAALHYLFAISDQQNAEAFFVEWAEGRAKKARAPSRYLQRCLVEIANESNHRVHETVRNALIIKAWNAFVAGRSVTKAEMMHALTDPFPRIDA